MSHRNQKGGRTNVTRVTGNVRAPSNETAGPFRDLSLLRGPKTMKALHTHSYFVASHFSFPLPLSFLFFLSTPPRTFHEGINREHILNIDEGYVRQNEDRKLEIFFKFQIVSFYVFFATNAFLARL